MRLDRCTNPTRQHTNPTGHHINPTVLPVLDTGIYRATALEQIPLPGTGMTWGEAGPYPQSFNGLIPADAQR